MAFGFANKNKTFGIYLNRWGDWFCLLPAIEILVRQPYFVFRIAWGFWGFEMSKRRK